MKTDKFEKPLSTQDEMENEYKNKKVKETEEFILLKIRYLYGLDWYDILDQNTFNKMVDQLSQSANKQLCDNELKAQIFNDCPKQLRGGVKIESIVKVIARKINDHKLPTEKSQKLFQVFIKRNGQQQKHEKPGYKSVLLYLFGLFGLSRLYTKIHEKQTKSVGVVTQSIVQTQYSSKIDLRGDQSSSPSVFGAVHKNSLMANNEVQGIFDKDIKTNLEYSADSGQGAAKIGEQTKEKGSMLVEGFKSIGYLILEMFFMQNDVSKKMEFSFGTTLSSLLRIIPIGYMFYLLLKGQGSEQDSINGSRGHQSDKFYL